jgi:YD repeat-containing protein
MVFSPLGCISTTSYDAAGRVSAEINGLGETTSYGYLCPCQLAGFDFVRFVSFERFRRLIQRRGSQGTGWRSLSHRSMAA